MIGINQSRFVFYWRGNEEDELKMSQSVTLGDVIDGHVELQFDDDTTLPLNDVDWGNDELYWEMV